MLNNFVESGLTAVNFVNIPSSMLKGRFLSLNPLLNAGSRHEIYGILKASISCFEKAWKFQRF